MTSKPLRPLDLTPEFLWLELEQEILSRDTEHDIITLRNMKVTYLTGLRTMLELTHVISNYPLLEATACLTKLHNHLSAFFEPAALEAYSAETERLALEEALGTLATRATNETIH